MGNIQDIKEHIEIPEGIKVSLDKILLKVKGPIGELSRKFFYPKVNMSIKDNIIYLQSKNPSKREKRIIGTFRSHIHNMIKGVSTKFTYKLKICSGHFPMNISQSNDLVLIKNFLGEKVPRKSKILPGVDLKIEGDIITVESINRELAGQTAANLEKATKITKRDKRVFQDGIYITAKPKRELN